MYEAHNMYLQAAVEGGLIAGLGLLTFLIWWFLHARNFKQVESWQRLGAMITPLAFAAGGLTQNAIQDSEVRYLLILSCTFCFAMSMPSCREKN
jgi:O-antigen ligase